MSEFWDHNPIDALFELPQKQEIINYVEEITYFSNQAEVDFINESYESYKKKPELPKGYWEKISDTNGTQLKRDLTCFATVIRETHMSVPWATITEKTLRAMLHYCIPIPTGYQTANCLKNQGFWIPEDIINYEYQTEKDFGMRILKLRDSLKALSSIKNSVLQNYFLDNFELYQQNRELVKEMINTNKSIYAGVNV